MQSGTGIFFGVLAKKIEATTVQYRVCMVCGSTVTTHSDERCPVCGSPASTSKVVERLP